jgi:hypothetical protein
MAPRRLSTQISAAPATYHYQRAPNLRSPCSATAAGAPPTSAASAPLPPPLDVNACPPPQRRPQQRVPHCSSFYCSVRSSGGREAATPCQHLRGCNMHRPTAGSPLLSPGGRSGSPCSFPFSSLPQRLHLRRWRCPRASCCAAYRTSRGLLTSFCCLAMKLTSRRHWRRSC